MYYRQYYSSENPIGLQRERTREREREKSVEREAGVRKSGEEEAGKGNDKQEISINYITVSNFI